ncbi:MAG: NAD-glutamate dehydrogenase, partial [Pseudomonadales bacterium]|nr:NAD-glutamate dehydrogenase [Pseudomonadales bacterium]
ALEEHLETLCMSWDQQLQNVLERLQVAIPVGLAVGAGLTPEYRQSHTPEEAAEDMQMVLIRPKDAALCLHLRLVDVAARRLKLVVLHQGEPLWLSDVLPVLESLGLRVMGERSYELPLATGMSSLHEFQGSWPEGLEVPQLERLHEVMLACLQGYAPVDGFNRLALVAGLQVDQIQVFRAYAYYQQQLGWVPGPATVADLLVQHPESVHSLWQRFESRWQQQTATSVSDQEVSWILYLATVSSRTADTVLRRYATLIDATVRCNYALNPQGVLAFKLAPLRIAGVPRPCPRHEIYVYAHEFSGVHLRFGAIARGGIRWSDRQDDFRTEILGLVKAQQVKNAVIVPVGAKGGFVLHDHQHRLTVNSDAWRAAGVAAYESFMAALLSLTDNQRDGQVVPVPGLLRHDGDDSYLVVAADKGTATFSDRANRISETHGFWLGDAFASGGRYGYDHKVMGITARGAYLSLQRHLWTLGRQDEAFSCIGIGDMSGDVFGNGMLLAPQMRLLAAFNHAHIFIDPEPEVGRAYAERQRLFALPRSGWNDYDTACLSSGGAIYARTEKLIEVSPQARAILDLPAGPLSPDALIQGLLRAPVDVIWNGGIGTYVKSAQESHADAGDHGNDALRVNGAELRARIVCEGGNLGMTQRGRVEFALAGGLCHTDFIDNSAGVDCSDREVNIKIALQSLVQRGSLSLDARNTLLASLQDGVAHRVLSDNRQQALLLSVAVAQQPARHNEFADFITFLEHEAGLDRELEGLPDARSWTVRVAREQWLTRPELAVLLAYAKNDLKMRLTELNLADDPACRDDLLRAFPAGLCTPYREVLMQHPLRHALVGTELANDFIHKLGITSLQRLQQRAGVTLADQVRAFVRVREVFELDELWAELMSDHSLPREDFGRMADQSMRYARLAVLWWTGEDDLVLSTADLDAIAQFWSTEAAATVANCPEHLMRRFGRLVCGERLLEIARLVQLEQRPVPDVVQAYTEVDELMGFTRLLQRMHERTVTNPWQAHANEAYVEQWRDLHRQLCARHLSGQAVLPVSALVEWQGLCSRLQVTDYQEAGLYAVLTQKLHRLMHLPSSA